jgi:hypothetical protein
MQSPTKLANSLVQNRSESYLEPEGLLKGLSILWKHPRPTHADQGLRLCWGSSINPKVKFIYSRPPSHHLLAKKFVVITNTNFSTLQNFWCSVDSHRVLEEVCLNSNQQLEWIFQSRDHSGKR